MAPRGALILDLPPGGPPGRRARWARPCRSARRPPSTAVGDAHLRLGLALAAAAPTARAVPAIANATLLPLAFFSDIFLIGALPRWMDTVGWIFPLKHFANAVADGVNPTVPGAGFFPDHLAVMAVWAVAAFVVARWRWTWEPRT